MTGYILKRLALMVPTLIGILLINFMIVQAAPGGPVEQMLAKLHGISPDLQNRMGTGAELKPAPGTGSGTGYRGAQGLDPELIKRIEKLYGFDKPAWERFVIMLKNYAVFDFGDSFYHDRSVVDLMIEKMPVSISLGLWTTLLIYLISIPLGIHKAVLDGSRFDVWTSTVIIAGYAIPGFMFAILLIVLFAGGTWLDWFPLRGLTSENFDSLPWYGKIADYAWHMVLPVTANVIGGFAALTILTKNSFLDEIRKQYVVTARAKGLEENRILYGHVFRNAMLIVIAGMPAALVSVFFTGSLLIEVVFSLDGLGLLGFQSTVNRDYPVMFGTLYIFTLVGLLLKLISDLTYVWVDPRINFENRERRT
ncbi:microcin C ABC transporter permease YejB [Hahella sp. SMD15-11]|uniref:Inner membrane ABC transporter permease protein YejB n=1 Tax=Thermohahella caldifontis TaxID=3142973 RepID=A0AB39UYH6_9GAMM